MAGDRQLVVIGLDGATWDVLEQAIEMGRLPFVQSRMAEGTWGTLWSTVPCLTCPAVPTLFSGVNPGRTGIFDFVKSDGAPVSALDFEVPMLWELASTQNKRCCVTNVRFTYPPQPLNGVLVCGGLSFGKREAYTYPPELMGKVGDFHSEQIQARTHRLTKDLDGNREQIYRDRIIQHKHRFGVFRGLMQGSRYDLGIHWVGTTDSIQHYCWDHQELIHDFFDVVDADIAVLWEELPEANFIIVSDHGFAGANTQAFYVNTWLQEMGYLAGSRSRLARSVSHIRGHIRDRISSRRKQQLKRLWRGLAGDASSRSDVTGERIRLPAFQGAYGLEPGVRWDETKAYLACKWGIGVAPELDRCEKDRISEDLIHRLRQLTDDAGQPVIQAAWRREELYSGKYLEQLPEVLFLTTPTYRARPQLSTGITGVDREADRRVSGAHDVARNGIILAWGPDIDRHEAIAADLVDIVPTALHLLGCRIPSDLDGEVLGTMFKQASMPGRRRIEYVGPGGTKERVGNGYSAEEAKAIKGRLRNLGYL